MKTRDFLNQWQAMVDIATSPFNVSIDSVLEYHYQECFLDTATSLDVILSFNYFDDTYYINHMTFL